MNTWGIDDGYRDIQGTWHATDPETRGAILASMGVGPRTPLPDPPVRVMRQGVPLPFAAEVTLESGESVAASAGARLPLGYHDARLRDGRELRLIVTPDACHLPEGLRAWGIATQVYSLRSARSAGMGDLGDLARLGTITRSLGGKYLLLNPLGATSPDWLDPERQPRVPEEPSPYYSASRLYRNPLYLELEAVPGADRHREAIALAGEQARSLQRGDRIIDRDAVGALKRPLLELLWREFSGDHPADVQDFERYLAEGGVWLQRFTTWCALAERHGPSWYDWPSEFRRHDSDAVRAFGLEARERVRFHGWLQWLIDRQLASANSACGLMHDLPIGFNSGGADGWVFKDFLAPGMSVGAPPDALAPGGQDWGLPPFIPHRLQEARYEPFIATIRQGLRHAWGLRIDHVMGLFRLFWCPHGRGARFGAYVRYPAQDLLGILALESQRAGAVVVGEDLGTVENGVREALARHNVLSYRLGVFESIRPERYPKLAMAALTTHDLATVAGVWTGQDERDQEAFGLVPHAEGAEEMRERLAQVGRVKREAPVEEVLVKVHAALAEAPSALLCATYEDLTASTDRPNLPGTTRERPNWSIAQATPLEELEAHPVASRVARALATAP